MSTQSSQPSLRPTHVVTSFLRRMDERPARILLVRRSQRVGSYRGQWAGVSGFIEPNVTPDEQAFTEIEEETGLGRNQVRMIRRGAIVEYIDEALGRHFFIHPFLFEVYAPGSIQTDWEATEMSWLLPSELPNYDTIPRLQDVYDSAMEGEVVSA